MNETEALELVHAVEAQDGQGSRTWQVTPVDDLGWAIAAVGVRSNGAYAVTRTGRVGRYVISTTRPREALEKLAALPDPRSQAEVADAAAAERLVETALARFGSLGQSGWDHVELGELGWRFTPRGVDGEVRFVVTRGGQVTLVPATDPTGADTARELIDRSAGRIPVAQLSP